MISRFIVPAACLLACVTFVVALPPVADFKEGSCSDFRFHPVPLNDRQRVLFDRMPYSPAGSRYLLYRYGSGHPNYADLREDQFYYEWCFLRNISTPTGAGSTTSWGRPWGDFGVRTVHGRPDIYLDSFSRTSTNPEAYTRLYVTLTDNKTFALVVACWNAENISSWHVISSTPRLSEKTLNLIESHAESYGFPRENFVRVRYDTCRRDDGRYLFSHDSIIDGAGRRRNYLY